MVILVVAGGGLLLANRRAAKPEIGLALVACARGRLPS